ncbi:J domain-containing protein [Haloarcula nitratireducens]|uniref:DnaJ domain-containing protein n=1 Tax=Haloarcula nitratireducens TaxID=2487749 RepID=A0AAW4P979_9EURY|nr:DnaJ domain-containing protein [Halomicroarcula nitratireducens]MBX0294220.1 DnaJ domain-containing protein [Halomicroarcula nitratireducens]
MSETFYEVLGVAEDATTDEIDAAYRERLKETHPDVNDDADARVATRKLVEARDVLVDETERARYDRVGHAAYVGNDPEPGGSDVARAARNAGYGTGSEESTRADSNTDDEDGSVGENDGRARRRSGDRTRRERRASERVRGNRSERETATETASRAENTAETGTTGTSPTEAAATATATGGTATGATAAGATGNGDGGVWNTSAGYTVRESVEVGQRGIRLFPTENELTVLGLMVVLYPALLFTTVMPGFPLYVNAIVGACGLLIVGYLQSMPRVALLVFGGWSLVTPLALFALDVGFLSIVGIVALCGTWLPLGFSVLTFSVLRL